MNFISALMAAGCVATLAWLTPVAYGGQVSYDPIIGKWRQLFADNYRIESLTDVERRLHPGDKRSTPVLVPDKPWEKGSTYLYGTVMFDEQEQIYKMWYQVFYMVPPKAYILYATSVDGLHWKKPDLGIQDWEGSKANNIVLEAEIGTVIKDDITSDPARRYKMFGFIRPHYDAFFSPDGVHWTKSEKEYVLKEGDVANAGYDPYNGDFYVLAKLPHPKGRATFLSRSSDFENWTTGIPVMVADERDQAQAKLEGTQKMEIYGMSATPYEGGYLGFPWMFRITGKGAKNSGGDGNIDVQLAYSRNLVEWARPIREAIIPNGIAGSFDDEMVFTSSRAVVRPGKVEMFYGAWDGPHGTFDRRAYIGQATWKTDRFVGLSNGGFTSGSILTKPLSLSASSLHVNCAITPGGELRAELLDTDGNILPGFEAANCRPVTGDVMDAALSWEPSNEIGALKGRDVRIRFILTGGELFSFWQR